MKKNLTHASVLALALLIGGVGVSSAYGGLGQGFEKPELTDEQKIVLEEIIDLKKIGDYEGAKALAEEAGLPYMRGYRGQHQERRESIRMAVDNNDYEAFMDAIEGTPKADMMTPEIFSKMIEMHALKEEGDYEGAREIMEELGFGKRGEYKKRFGNRG